jgi:hypothetical protein
MSKLPIQDYEIIKLGLKCLKNFIPFSYKIDGKEIKITDKIVKETEDVVDNIGIY